jgi:hypothetical protein
MNPSVLIISFEPLVFRLKEHIERQFQRTVETLILPRQFFDEEPVYEINEYIRYYEEICRYLDAQKPASLRNFHVIFTVWANFDDFKDWNPLLYYEESRKRPYPPEVLLSWLVLTYPEVRWIFLRKAGSACSHPSAHFHCLNPDLDLSGIFGHMACLPLFDPCDMRNRIKKNLVEQTEQSGRSIVSGIPVRELQAAAIDDEVSYVYMNAYAAYRFGYRAWGINSWEILNALMSNPQQEIDLVFEDLYLSFPDRPSSFDKGTSQFKQKERILSNLKYLDFLLPAFNNVKRRILVTVGRRRTKEEKDRWQLSHDYLKTLSAKKKILYKPFAGIFDLWKEAGLWQKAKDRPEYPEHFDWPPKKETFSAEGSTHSAPGKLLIIAQRLIRRATRLLKEAESVPDALQSAVLALEAKELLACRTPTTALEALALQHQAEIVAESMFYGIEYNLNVEDRFKDIQREVKAISYGFNPQSAEKSAINSRLTITENLANKFRELNQFEEEHDCLAEARKLRLEFWLRQRAVNRLARPFIKYIDFLLRSLGHFLAVVVVWIFLFAFVYFLSSPMKIDTFSFWDAFAASTDFFFTLEPANNWQEVKILGSENWWNLVLAFQGIVSFSNLGLLLAHLYMIISRK